MTDELFGGARVEIDYAIVDRESLEVRPIADLVLGAAGRLELGPVNCGSASAKHLLVLAGSRSIEERSTLTADFQRAVREIDARLESHSAMLLPGGMHPFMASVAETPNAQGARFDLPFRDASELDRLRVAARAVLPLVPALAASSPIAAGQPTGRLDTRIERDDLEPIAHRDRRAVELRIQDVAECPAADLAIAEAVIAAVQALYHEQFSTYADQRRLPEPPLADLLRDVARSGERAVVSDPRLLDVLGFPGRTTDAPKAGEVWTHLIEATLGDSAEHLLSRARLDVILREGPLARRILARGEIRETYRELARCLVEGRMLRARPLSPPPSAASSGSARA